MASIIAQSATIAPVARVSAPRARSAAAAKPAAAKPVLAARASLAGRAVPARASRVERMATRQTAFTVSASGSATVGKGQGDLEMVTLKGTDGSVAEIYPFGGVVTSWVKDGRDVLYVRPDAKFDKSKPISGGIPHCWPQFGPGDMQVHGFARNVDWEVTKTADGDAPMVEMTLLPSDYTKAMWPADFKATQTITLKDGALTATMAVCNPSKEEFSFTGSFHTYFAASIDDVKVGGLDGLKMTDRLAGNDMTNEGDVTISGPVDACYYDAPKALTLAVGGGKTVGIASTGWPDAVVWSPWTDMEACYKEFVCVENAACAPVKVAPGATWTGSMTLTA